MELTMGVGPGTDYTLAAKTISQFEGFAASAYWDVNAWRIGYGSDTRYVPASDHYVRVLKGDRTTQDAALHDLQHRIPAFEATIIKQIGMAAWARLPQPARAALLSLAYNYGRLPFSIAGAVGAGHSLAEIAALVEARKADNKGVNEHRRIVEANMIRTAA